MYLSMNQTYNLLNRTYFIDSKVNYIELQQNLSMNQTYNPLNRTTI